jgi:tetratricopeptide (TPR) repeat protein
MARRLPAPLLALALLLAGAAPAYAAPAASAPPPSEVTPIPAVPQPPTPAKDYFANRLQELSGDLEKHIASPRALAILYRIDGLVPDLPSLEPLAKIYGSAASDRRAVPEARRLAQYLLSQLEVHRGHLARARESLGDLAFATQGWLIGGFDNEGGAGHSTAYPPEQGPLDLKGSYQGKERTVSWRTVPPLGPSGFVPVSDLLRPTTNITFYYLTTVQTPRDTAVVFHLGTSGASKLWVNGQLLAEDPDDHPARFDQHAVLAHLKSGASTLLLKVSTLDERPGFFLRVSAEGDRPALQVRFAVPEPGAQLASCVADSKPPPYARVTDATAELAALVEKQKHPQDGHLLEDYATLLDARRPYDSKQQLARRKQERVIELLPQDPRAQALLGRYIEDDQNLRREALEHSLEANPHWAPSRATLAGYYSEHGFARRGYDEAVRAAADGPDYYPAQLGVIESLASLGLEARGQRQLLELAEKYPTTPLVQLAAARAERSLGRIQQATARYRRVLELRYDDRDARAELLNLRVDAGDIDGALELLRRAVDLAPTSVGSALRLADFLSFNGHPQEAVALYDQLASIAPDDDGVFESRGQHELRGGDTRGALKDFEHALALKPQNPRLRDLVRSVQPQDDYATPWLRDAVALARSAPATPPNADDGSLVLVDLNVVRVYPNGLSSRVHQVVQKVFNQRGVDEARVEGLRYAPDQQDVKVQRARIIKKDGTVVEAKSESDQRLNDSYGGMYFDSRQRTIVFSNLEPGDVVELTTRRDDVAQQNMFADYFGDVEYLQGTDPRADVDYVLLAPAERTFYWNQPALGTVVHTTEKTADGLQLQRWRASNVPRIEPEPKMPGWANVAAYLHVSTFKDWADMGRFWWGLIHDQLHVTPEVAAAAEEAVKGIPASDVRGRVRGVYDYVVTKTHYVGIEFGIQGFKPHRVDQILSRLWGDCKDKASLMHAMLDHLGIKSNLVLLRMRFLGQLTPAPASLAAFNHAILYVPELNQYLDGTAEFSGSGELPDADQGAQALIVREDGTSTFVTTPMSKADENVVDYDYALQIAADGSAVLNGTGHVRGDPAQGFRRNYESESGRRERFEQSYAQRYPGAKAVNFDIGDPHAIEQDVLTHFALTVPQLAHKDGDALVFSPFGEPWRFLEGNAPQSKRNFAVDLGTPWSNQFRYTIHVPSGYALADQPSVVEKESPFGRYRYETKLTPEGVVVTGNVAFTVPQVNPTDYAAFRTFLEDLDRTFSRRLRVAPAVPHATEAAR